MGHRVSGPEGAADRAGSLPLPLTSLVGRERETAAVRRLVGDARLVTLTGPGGCGKTRLALAAAGELAGSSWWIELAALAEPGMVSHTVATALGVREQAGHGPERALVHRLRGVEALLVLDNCEHLLDACAALVAELLSSCPALRVLTTSRAPLRVDGERTWPVPPLSVPDPDNPPPLPSLLRYEGVQLFVERARAVDPAFAVDAENAPALARVCRRLDGIPLAIELAAARARVLTVEEIAARLDHSFALLTGGSRAVPPRQRTLRAAIEWSYDLLDGPGQVLFRRLAVFAGGFTLDAADHVCADGPGDVLDGLASLVDSSLVLVEKRAGRSHYRLLETVREYGQEKLADSGEEPAVRARHAGYVLRLAEHLEPAINGPGRHRSLDTLESEHDNLRAALAWCFDAADGSGPRLAGALLWFWWFRGYVIEGRRWLDAAVAALDGDASSVAAKAMTGAGMLGWAHGDSNEAQRTLQRAVALWRELGDGPRLAEALRILSATHEFAGELELATALVEESVRLCRSDPDPFGLAMGLGRLGITAISRRDYAAARAALEEAAAVSRAAGDDWVLALVLRHRGIGALRQDDIEAACAALTEALTLLRVQGERLLTVQCLETLASALAAGGDHRRAAVLFSALDTQRESFGLSVIYPADLDRGVATVRAGLGPAATATAWAEGAAMTMEEAVELALVHRPAGNPGGLTDREVDILALVARGMTNAQIGATLFLSARTVNWHLTSVYGKLGVRSRTEAARFALDHGLGARGPSTPTGSSHGSPRSSPS